MEERTLRYLRGRFGDYYRNADLSLPPDADEREWGIIPWTQGAGTRMVRHRSLLDMGDLGDFLQRERPRHAYFSAGRYDDPGANTMDGKGWRDSDLVFDLDADHLPGVDPQRDSYAEMLAACKDELSKLLVRLEGDFDFDDLSVVFSGGRGYHVHVRDPAVRRLDSGQRREIVDYVRGIDVKFEALVEETTVGGSAGRSSPAKKRTLNTEGGWGRLVHEELLAFVDELRELDDEDAIDRLCEFEGIGEGHAKAALTVARENYEGIQAGNLDVHASIYKLARQLTTETIKRRAAAIDEPVTTDTHRLIRLPGSLHGGSGLVVTPIDRDDLADFDPLVDAVPEQFTGNEVRIDVTDGGPVELGGETFTLKQGEVSVPEYVAVFMMARGRAEKEREP